MISCLFVPVDNGDMSLVVVECQTTQMVVGQPVVL